MPLYMGLHQTRVHREREEHTPHLCSVLTAPYFTASPPQAAARGGAELCCFEFSPGEIGDEGVVQIEGSEEFGKVLVGAVSVRRDIPRGGEQEVLQAVLSRQVFD